MLDGPESIDRLARRCLVLMAVLAIVAPCLCLAEGLDRLGQGIYRNALSVILIAAVPLTIAISILVARKARLVAAGQVLSTRDLDAVVAYALRLGVAHDARQRAQQTSESVLRYPGVEGFLDWMEQRALLLRVLT